MERKLDIDRDFVIFKSRARIIDRSGIIPDRLFGRFNVELFQSGQLLGGMPLDVDGETIGSVTRCEIIGGVIELEGWISKTYLFPRKDLSFLGV